MKTPVDAADMVNESPSELMVAMVVPAGSEELKMGWPTCRLVLAAAKVNEVVPEVPPTTPVMAVAPAVPKLRKPVEATGAALRTNVVPSVIEMTVPV